MFYLFYGPVYYPGGGAVDFKGKFGEVWKAKRSYTTNTETPEYEWCHITDSELNIIQTMSYDRDTGDFTWEQKLNVNG